MTRPMKSKGGSTNYFVRMGLDARADGDVSPPIGPLASQRRGGGGMANQPPAFTSENGPLDLRCRANLAS